MTPELAEAVAQLNAWQSAMVTAVTDTTGEEES